MKARRNIRILPIVDSPSLVSGGVGEGGVGVGVGVGVGGVGDKPFKKMSSPSE